MSYSVYDFVADQLRAAAPDAEWNIEGVDRAQELATILVDRANVRDMSRLSLVKVTRQFQTTAWSTPELKEDLAFVYDNRQFGFLGSNDTPDIQPVLQPNVMGYLVAWSALGKGNVTYSIQPAASGFAIVPKWGSSSDRSRIGAQFKFIASLAISFFLPAAGIAVGATIGSAIIGPTLAAAYPALATAVGNVAIAAAFNGGDIKGAAKSAALSYIGAEAGAMVGSAANIATNAEIIGKMAEAGTRAFITGGDPRRAAGLAALGNAGAVVDFFTPSEAVTVDIAEDFGLYEFDPYNAGGFDDATAFELFADSFDPSTFNADAWSTGAVQTSGDFQPVFLPVPGVDIPVMQPLPIPDVEVAPPPQNDPGASAGWNAREVINNVSNAALTAINLVGAWRRMENPTINTQARAVTQSGAVVSALDNGTVQTRGPNGQTTVARPPVGVAQSTVNGNIVVNNGDGTFSLVTPSGQTRVIKYGSESSDSGLGSLPWPAIIGGVGLLVAVLK